MQKYEYKILAADARGGWLSAGGKLNYEELANSLNEFGQQGWEVVSATDVNRYEGATRDVMIILKRPLTDN
jgi:Domain of unknown function (DUF4177)